MLEIGIRTTDPKKIAADLGFLVQCFKEVLEEYGHPEVAHALPFLNESPLAGSIVAPEQLAQASSIAFRLLTMVEQHAAADHRHQTEEREGMAAVPSLWADSFQKLKDRDISEDAIAAALERLRVEIVLTAHPTEAKRATVLEHHRHLFLLLASRDRQVLTSFEKKALREEVKAWLMLLWRTGDIFLQKPDVASERRNVIHYLQTVFPKALPLVDQRLRHAWEHAGLPAELLDDPDKLPLFEAGTWVGGDRDGHPLVTAEVTRETLQALRTAAIRLQQDQLRKLICRLSLSDLLQGPPAELVQRVDQLAQALGEHGATVRARNPDETWRQLIGLMMAKLPGSRGDQNYRDAAEFMEDLKLLRRSLFEVGAGRIAVQNVDPVIRRARMAGFHLARLDIRQNSAFHDRAISLLLAARGATDDEFATWDEKKRQDFLLHALRSGEQQHKGEIPGDEAGAVLSCYKVVRDHLRDHGSEGIGASIVSMTRSVSDLLAVHFFAKEAGISELSGEGAICPLEVVPLFETIDDLEHSAGILREYLQVPIVRLSLEAQQRASGASEPVQQVMVGYSDSNKDGGIFASLWGLYRAQAAMADLGRELGIRIRFFHGRGGSISRGAGPTHRFIKAMPHDALQGDLRLTEQGETIAQKYGNRLTAAFNMELLMAGVVRATVLDEHDLDPAHALEPVMDRLAAMSRKVYTSLICTDGFITFFRQATPVDAIEESRIGSRPARRTGKATLADLRAIPWVFSWGQARFFLSGWYGVGSALEAVVAGDPKVLEQLKEHLIGWSPLHYVLSNAATSIAMADPGMMREYAALVQDADIRDRILQPIIEEHARTRKMLEKIYDGPLHERRPNIHDLIQMRQEGLKRLHRQQIGLLKQWRSDPPQEKEELDRLHMRLLLTMNAIASGVGATG